MHQVLQFTVQDQATITTHPPEMECPSRIQRTRQWYGVGLLGWYSVGSGVEQRL